MRKLVACFWAVTPGLLDLLGQALLRHLARRFCTRTRPLSRSVPISKVTVSRYEPSLEQVEDMSMAMFLHAVDLLLDRARLLAALRTSKGV